MRRLSTLFALCAMSLAVFTACQNEPPKAEQIKYTDSALTPDEHKARLQDITCEFMDILEDIKAQTQPLIESMAALNEYSQQADEYVNNLNHSIETANVNGIINAITRASEQFIIDINSNDSPYNGYTVTYDENGTPTTVENGRLRQFEIKWDESHVTIEWGKNDGTYTFHELNSDCKYIVEVPAFIKVSYKIAEVEHLYIKLVPNLTDRYSYAPEMTIKFIGGYEITSSLDATSDHLSAGYALKKEGKKIMGGSCATKADDVTNIDNWYHEECGEYDRLPLYFFYNIGDSVMQLDFLALSLIGTGDMTGVVETCNDYIDLYDGELRSQMQCEILNSNMNMIAVYSDTKEKAADIIFEVWSRHDVDHYNYYVGMALVFPDGSKVLFRDFFTEDNFGDFMNRYNGLFE